MIVVKTLTAVTERPFLSALTARRSVPLPPLVCFGPGYVASRLSAGWRFCGGESYASVREPSRVEALEQAGWRAIPLWAGATLKLPEQAIWLISAPPNADGCPIFARLAAQAETAQAVIYLSTTGVYGDLKGGWAFESVAAQPSSPRSMARLVAEAQWQSLQPRTVVLRLPGIYGPDRSPFADIRSGTARIVNKPGQVFSRAHVDDICAAIARAGLLKTASGVFNVADDRPSTPREVQCFAASLLGMPPPPEVPIDAAGLSPMGLSFYAECKRVPNAKAKAVLGWRPAYPTFAEGLAACLTEETTAER